MFKVTRDMIYYLPNPFMTLSNLTWNEDKCAKFDYLDINFL